MSDIDLYASLFLDVSQFNRELKLATDVGRLSSIGVNTEKIQEQMRNSFILTGEQIDHAFKQGEMMASRFDMRLLTVLFTAQYVERVFGSMFKSIMNTFEKAENDTSALSQSTLRLSAAWEFLKFSIADTLNTPFFIGFIEGIINAIDWISELIDKYPGIGQGLITAFGVLAVGGAIFAAIGTFAIFWGQVFGPGGLLAGSVASGLASMALSFVGWTAAIIAGIVIVGFAFDKLFGIKTGWLDALDGMGKGFTEFVTGIITGDFNLLLTGFVRFFGNLGALTYNSIIGIISTVYVLFKDGMRLAVQGGLEGVKALLSGKSFKDSFIIGLKETFSEASIKAQEISSPFLIDIGKLNRNWGKTETNVPEVSDPFKRFINMETYEASLKNVNNGLNEVSLTNNKIFNPSMLDTVDITGLQNNIYKNLVSTSSQIQTQNKATEITVRSLGDAWAYSASQAKNYKEILSRSGSSKEGLTAQGAAKYDRIWNADGTSYFQKVGKSSITM